MLNLLLNEEPQNFFAKFKICLAAKFMTDIVDSKLKSQPDIKYRRTLEAGTVQYTFLTKNTKFFLGQGQEALRHQLTRDFYTARYA
jgi:hypothetical protein